MTPQPGDPLPRVELTVDREPMKVMALLLRDSNAIHFDVETVARLGLGDRTVNQGPINLGYAISMLAAWAGGDDRIRSYDARFLANVFAGDTVVAGGVVESVEPDDGKATVQCAIWVDHLDRQRVVEGTAVVVIPTSGRSSPSAPTGRMAAPTVGDHDDNSAPRRRAD